MTSLIGSMKALSSIFPQDEDASNVVYVEYQHT